MPVRAYRLGQLLEFEKLKDVAFKELTDRADRIVHWTYNQFPTEAPYDVANVPAQETGEDGNYPNRVWVPQLAQTIRLAYDETSPGREPRDDGTDGPNAVQEMLAHYMTLFRQWEHNTEPEDTSDLNKILQDLIRTIPKFAQDLAIFAATSTPGSRWATRDVVVHERDYDYEFEDHEQGDRCTVCHADLDPDSDRCAIEGRLGQAAGYFENPLDFTIHSPDLQRWWMCDGCATKRPLWRR